MPGPRVGQGRAWAMLQAPCFLCPLPHTNVMIAAGEESRLEGLLLLFITPCLDMLTHPLAYLLFTPSVHTSFTPSVHTCHITITGEEGSLEEYAEMGGHEPGSAAQPKYLMVIAGAGLGMAAAAGAAGAVSEAALALSPHGAAAGRAGSGSGGGGPGSGRSRASISYEEDKDGAILLDSEEEQEDKEDVQEEAGAGKQQGSGAGGGGAQATALPASYHPAPSSSSSAATQPFLAVLAVEPSTGDVQLGMVRVGATGPGPGSARTAHAAGGSAGAGGHSQEEGGGPGQGRGVEGVEELEAVLLALQPAEVVLVEPFGAGSSSGSQGAPGGTQSQQAAPGLATPAGKASGHGGAGGSGGAGMQAATGPAAGADPVQREALRLLQVRCNAGQGCFEQGAACLAAPEFMPPTSRLPAALLSQCFEGLRCSVRGVPHGAAEGCAPRWQR